MEEIVDEQNQRLYRSWGDFLTKKDLFKEANVYYTKCLEIIDKDAQALYRKSICLCDFAKSEEAVIFAKNALDLSPHRLDINLQVPDALFDSNDFENSKIELHNNARKYDKLYRKQFENRLDIIHENYISSLGDQYAVFAQESNIVKIAEDLKALTVSDKPLWKLLKEQEKCDVVSIVEKEQELLHPREIERRKLCYKNFTQLFLHKGAKDLQFLADLRYDQTFLLPQTRKSTKKLKALTNEKYNVAFKFLKMLQARGPVYSQKFKTKRDQLLAAQLKECHIFRLQYQTRRDMFNILKKINYLRSQGKLEELSKVVDHTIREYVILKTYKVMPRKFEFINEVCNILALTYVDRLKVPENILEIRDRVKRIRLLLHVPVIKEKEYFEFVFGDKTTFTDPEAKDIGFINYSIRLGRLEKRLRFATFPIERCYFYHEIAVSHLKQSKNDMCIIMANKTIAEALLCKNKAWEILGYQLICQTLVSQEKLERLREILVKIIKVLKKSKIPRILQVFLSCKKFNEQAIEDKILRRNSAVSIRSSRVAIP